MTKLDLIFDLTSSLTKKDVFDQFASSFGFKPYHSAVWDAFYDDITSLHTQSSTVIEKKPKAVHLLLKNIHNFKQNSYEEYKILIELLADATDKKQRYDNIAFTFEIINDIDIFGYKPLPDYCGGRIFKNIQGYLPGNDDVNYYKEYDVKPYKIAVNRGAERFIVSKNKEIYYTETRYGDNPGIQFCKIEK